MRIPFPERISYTGATVAACVLLIVQLFQHTTFYFSLCCFAYILVVTAAFNIAGGLYRPSGAYIFFNATLTLLIGLATKAVLGEPAQSNLSVPLLSIQIYLLGAVAMLAAAYIENRFRKPVPVVVKLFPLANLRAAYIGSAIIGIATKILVLSNFIAITGAFLTVFNTFDQFLPFAMILGVMYTVRASNGKKSLTVGLAIIFIAMTLLGLLSFSKQAIYTPAFCWLIGVGMSRYNLRPVSLMTATLTFFLLAHYGSPYSQVGRLYEGTTIKENFYISWFLLTHMDKVFAEETEANLSVGNAAFKMAYFNQSEGLFDRLEMFSPDDALIFATERDGYFGYKPIIEQCENIIPHFIWPDKPVPYFGNVYGHQIGILATDDMSTSISFGISADAYHQGGIVGVLVAETLILALSFVTLSRILGDARDHPIGLVAVLVMAHYAPEGGTGCAIIFIQVSLTLLALAFTCNYILPIFSSILEPRKPWTSLPGPAVSAG